MIKEPIKQKIGGHIKGVVIDYCSANLYQEGLSKSTVKGRRNVANNFTDYLISYHSQLKIEEISLSEVNLWLKDLIVRQGIQQNTVNTYARCIRTFFKYLNDNEINHTRWQSIPIPKKVDTKREYVTVDEVMQLIQSAKTKRDKAIIAVLFTSGIRIGELVELKTKDVRNREFQIVGKGGRLRTCYIDPFADQLLTSYLKSRDQSYEYLFISQTGRQMHAYNLNKMLKRTALLAGWNDRNISAHMFRHGFATTLVKNGMNLRHIQILMGHSKLSTTEIYTHVVQPELKGVHDNFMTLS